jgi:adenylosuccinate lyase
MRGVWSELHRRRLWRRIWVALAEAQQAAGLVRPEQTADLRAHAEDIDLERALAIEAEIHHDLMAEVKTYAEQCRTGGAIIHLGATSMDIEDNAEALRLREALDLLIERLGELLLAFADRIDAEAETPTMAFTHLQPAEPTTVGYRLAQYAQDLLTDYEELERARKNLRGKGLKGAVGTSASYAQLLTGTGMTPAELEARVMASLGLEAFPVATQIYPRKQEFLVLSALASLAQSVYKFAFDLRFLQTPPVGEWAEPFREGQVGSSAMPFKRNPIHAENIDSLGRLLAALPRVAWDNAAHTLLERTLDDSANRRTILPEGFLIADEIVTRGLRLIRGLRVDRLAAERLLAAYGPFAATERLLMELARRGADRQAMHELIREHSMRAWAATQRGEENPLIDSLCADRRLLGYAAADEMRDWLDASNYVGDAPERAAGMGETIRATVQA